eukprot:2209170-Prymnesium_polylepis.1
MPHVVCVRSCVTLGAGNCTGTGCVLSRSNLITKCEHGVYRGLAASIAWEYGWRPSHVRHDAEGFDNSIH